MDSDGWTTIPKRQHKPSSPTSPNSSNTTNKPTNPKPKPKPAPATPAPVQTKPPPKIKRDEDFGDELDFTGRVREGDKKLAKKVAPKKVVNQDKSTVQAKLRQVNLNSIAEQISQLDEKYPNVPSVRIELAISALDSIYDSCEDHELICKSFKELIEFPINEFGKENVVIEALKKLREGIKPKDEEAVLKQVLTFAFGKSGNYELASLQGVRGKLILQTFARSSPKYICEYMPLIQETLPPKGRTLQSLLWVMAQVVPFDKTNSLHSWSDAILPLLMSFDLEIEERDQLYDFTSWMTPYVTPTKKNPVEPLTVDTLQRCIEYMSDSPSSRFKHVYKSVIIPCSILTHGCRKGWVLPLLTNLSSRKNAFVFEESYRLMLLCLTHDKGTVKEWIALHSSNILGSSQLCGLFVKDFDKLIPDSFAKEDFKQYVEKLKDSNDALLAQIEVQKNKKRSKNKIPPDHIVAAELAAKHLNILYSKTHTSVARSFLWFLLVLLLIGAVAYVALNWEMVSQVVRQQIQQLQQQLQQPEKK